MSTANCSFHLALTNLHQNVCTTAPAIQLQVFNSIDQVPQNIWKDIIREDEMFLGIDYLKGFESSVSDNVAFRYVLFKQNGRHIGVASFQIITFRANNIKNDDAGLTKRMLAKCIQGMSFRVMMCGNAFMTGEYGCWFGERLATAEQVDYLRLAIDTVKQQEQAAGNGIDVLLVKDLFEDQEPAFDVLQDAGYMKFQVQPDMIFEVNPEWKSFDDYLAAMSSKYRVRVRRALKDFKGITVRTMSLEEVKQQMSVIEDLYLQVIDRSAFKLATFDIKHLVPMYENLGADKFECRGFFKGDELVAFTSCYAGANNDKVAGMLGFRKDLQRKHDLYFNMLIEIVKDGIDRKFGRIIMGRTAMEIKSSLGAVPKDMTLYIKHTSRPMNAVCKPIMRQLIQVEEWNQRHPFKEEIN